MSSFISRKEKSQSGYKTVLELKSELQVKLFQNKKGQKKLRYPTKKQSFSKENRQQYTTAVATLNSHSNGLHEIRSWPLFTCSIFKYFQTVYEGEIWCLCTVTFDPKGPNLNSRPVYTARDFTVITKGQ